MISVKQVYSTSDGTTFCERSEAEAHERMLMKKWLDTRPKVDIVALMDKVDNRDDDEYYCTEFDLVMRVAHLAWEQHNGN